MKEGTELTLDERISETLHGRKLLTIWWDTQDPNNEGPAYMDGPGGESGPLHHIAWARADGRPLAERDVDGYLLEAYFSGPDREYIGPDQDGVYPVLER